MTGMHVVPAADFAELAAGLGGPDVVTRLRSGRFSKNLLLLRALLDEAPAEATALRSGYALLAKVQEVNPDAVAALLIHPHVSAWAVHSVRVLRGKIITPVSTADLLGHLAGVAASAAIWAGVDFEIDVPVRAGEIVLPGVGRAQVGQAQPFAAVHGRSGGLTIDGVPTEMAGMRARWQPVHHLVAESDGLQLVVGLDAVDWYRDCHDMGAVDRLDGEQAAVWQHCLTDAWTLLVRNHRDHAAAIAAGLTTLVPLRTDLTNRGVTATSMDAFGAMALSAPTDAMALSVGLVHEFQHAKLGALMDLVRLHDPIDECRYYAPWRDDPRPLGGLLHGAYAFLGVADFWRVRRHHHDEHTRYAEFEFARWRERVSRVIGVLADSGHLTEAGARFLAGMRRTVDGWWDEPVPADPTGLAKEAADDHWLCWRVRNLSCEPGAVELLAKAWRAGEDAPHGTAVPVKTEPSPRVFRRQARLHLIALRVTEPERLAALAADPDALHSAVPDATDADLAYAGNQPDVAVAGYQRLVAAQPERDEHWAGLALSLRLGGPGPAVATLLVAPEVVAAVYRAVRAAGDTITDPDQSPDPVALATWLAPLFTDSVALSR
jgi:HEXXH motif-containing protein